MTGGVVPSQHRGGTDRGKRMEQVRYWRAEGSCVICSKGETRLEVCECVNGVLWPLVVAVGAQEVRHSGHTCGDRPDVHALTFGAAVRSAIE